MASVLRETYCGLDKDKSRKGGLNKGKGTDCVDILLGSM